MSYTIDSDLKQGLQFVEEGKKVVAGLKLINKSARTGTTKGKSYFAIGSIIKTGKAGIVANPVESKRYFDAAMEHFKSTKCDSLDHREMGEYYHYGLGSENVDLNRALEYYDLATLEGDEVAQQRAEEIRGMQRVGSASANPILTPDTQVKETPSGVENVAPVITSEGEPAPVVDPLIADVIDAEQLCLKALRILDSVTASKQDKLDAVELLKAASENGSARAAVLMGYLYEGDNSLVEQDYALTKKYYEMAIEHDSAVALYRLGVLYTDKDFVEFNPKKGHELIILSARKGYAWALSFIGDCFRAKVVDSRNLDLAYRYYAMAGERGLGVSYHSMAEIDASRQQLELAKLHERLAVENGYDPNVGYQDPLFYSLHI